MPASRIAFALTDFAAEVIRLMPLDSNLKITVQLNSPAFEKVVSELAEYGNLPRPDPDVSSVRFGGVRVERMRALDEVGNGNG